MCAVQEFGACRAMSAGWFLVYAWRFSACQRRGLFDVEVGRLTADFLEFGADVFVRDRRGFDRSPNPDEFTFPEMICDVGLAHLGWIEVDRMKHCQGQHRLGDALIFRFIVVHVELHLSFRRVRTTVLNIVPSRSEERSVGKECVGKCRSWRSE